MKPLRSRSTLLSLASAISVWASFHSGSAAFQVFLRINCREDLHQAGDDSRPAGLMTRTQASAVVAMEVFVEQHAITPMRIVLKGRIASEHRTPTLAEAATCKPFLLREIAIVRPKVIVVLGNTAMKNLLETKEGITKVRGKFQDYKGIKVMPTFHPAYLLRDPSKKRETWEDMKKVRDYLNSVTSDE